MSINKFKYSALGVSISLAILTFPTVSNSANITVSTGNYAAINSGREDKTYTGTGSEVMTFNQYSNGNPTIQVNGGHSLIFQDLSKIAVTASTPTEKTEWSSALSVRPDGNSQSSMKLENVANVSIGTKESSADYYWSIYMTRGSFIADGGEEGAKSGTFEIWNDGHTAAAGTNESTAGYGIYSTVQTWLPNNTTPVKWTAEAVITNYETVDIHTLSYGIVSSLISTGSSSDKNESSVRISAGNVNVEAQQGMAVAAYDSQDKIGNVGVDIEAEHTVSLISEENSALFARKLSEGTAEINISSQKGSIDIKSNSENSATIHLIGTADNNPSINLNADEISVVSKNDSGTAVLVEKNGNLNFNAQTEGTTRITGKVSAADGTIGLKSQSLHLEGNSTFTAGTVRSNKGEILYNSDQNGVVTIGSIVNEGNEKLVIAQASSVNDKYATAEEAINAARKQVSVGEGDYIIEGRTGAVSDAWSVNSDGTVSVRNNPVMESFSHFNSMSYVQWRNETNAVRERIGDVRNEAQTVGLWARVYGADSKVKETTTVEVKTNSLQIGADGKIGDWLIGAAFTYLDLDGDFSNGSSEADGYSFAAYTTGTFDCGAYVDVIGRIGKLSTDLSAFTDAESFNASYDNTGFSLSTEVGYRWEFNEVFFVDPQVELTYSYLNGDDFTSSNVVHVNQDDFQSLVGRFGANLGAHFNGGKDSVYISASVNHDFLGDADYTAYTDTSAVRSFSNDLGGTWYTYGVGAQFAAGENLNFYGTLQKSSGNDFAQDYRYSVGMRYVF